MKLPRWLLIGMLTSSVLAVHAAAGWWWVTWPERTMSAFVDEEIAWERGDVPQVLPDVPDWWRGKVLEYLTNEPNPLPPFEMQPEQRTLRDILIARQVFKGPQGTVFVAERGAIEGGGHPSSMLYLFLRRIAVSSEDLSSDVKP